jgi:dihydrodipicolinate synthase/N-acetylneuraminate lyase
MSKRSPLTLYQHMNLVGAKDHTGKVDRTSVEIERQQKEKR